MASKTFFFKTLFQRYNRFLLEKPLVTKAVTSGVICCAADLTCQLAFPPASAASTDDKSRKNPSVDFKRLGKFTMIGTFFAGPMLHYWYGYLAVKVTGNTVVSTLQRVALDQFVFAPAYLATFLSLMLLVDGETDKIGTKLQHDWWPTTLSNCTFWVPMQLVNFRMVPPHMQVLFASAVGYIWNIYLSNAVGQKQPVFASVEDGSSTNNGAKTN